MIPCFQVSQAAGWLELYGCFSDTAENDWRLNMLHFSFIWWFLVSKFHNKCDGWGFTDAFQVPLNLTESSARKTRFFKIHQIIFHYLGNSFFQLLPFEEWSQTLVLFSLHCVESLHQIWRRARYLGLKRLVSGNSWYVCNEFFPEPFIPEINNIVYVTVAIWLKRFVLNGLIKFLIVCFLNAYRLAAAFGNCLTFRSNSVLSGDWSERFLLFRVKPLCNRLSVPQSTITWMALHRTMSSWDATRCDMFISISFSRISSSYGVFEDIVSHFVSAKFRSRYNEITVLLLPHSFKFIKWTIKFHSGPLVRARLRCIVQTAY